MTELLTFEKVSKRFGRKLDIFEKIARTIGADIQAHTVHAVDHVSFSIHDGEVVGLVQTVQCFLPQPSIHEIVPLGDEVVDRATTGHAADKFAGMAEWHAAVHAARALIAEFLLLHVNVEFLPVLRAFERRAVDGKFAEVFDEAGWFAHDRKS